MEAERLGWIMDQNKIKFLTGNNGNTVIGNNTKMFQRYYINIKLEMSRIHHL